MLANQGSQSQVVRRSANDVTLGPQVMTVDFSSDAIGRLGPLLVGSDSDVDQRLGALGIFIAAIGLVAAAFATWVMLSEASE